MRGRHYTVRVSRGADAKTYFVTGQGLQLSLPIDSPCRYESRVKADAALLRAQYAWGDIGRVYVATHFEGLPE